jgi:hypothetical protein
MFVQFEQKNGWREVFGEDKMAGEVTMSKRESPSSEGTDSIFVKHNKQALL